MARSADRRRPRRVDLHARQRRWRRRRASAQGDSVTELYTVTVTDENGATDTQAVTITITGTNDAPDITSTPAPRSRRSHRAAGGRRRHSCDRPASATGTLDATDVDTGDDRDAGVGAFRRPTTYGSRWPSTPATGEWTYTLDNTAAPQFSTRATGHRGLHRHRHRRERRTDTQTVTITITGTNDAPSSPRPAAPRLKAQSAETGLAADDTTAVTDRRARPAR